MIHYDYTSFDKLVIERVRSGATTFSAICVGEVAAAAKKIANHTGRDADRILDGRLQALRKAGKLTHDILNVGWRIK